MKGVATEPRDRDHADVPSTLASVSVRDPLSQEVTARVES